MTPFLKVICRKCFDRCTRALRCGINECFSSVTCRFLIFNCELLIRESVCDLIVRKYLGISGVPLVDIIIPLTVASEEEISTFSLCTCVVFFYFSLNNNYDDRRTDILSMGKSSWRFFSKIKVFFLAYWNQFI